MNKTEIENRELEEAEVNVYGWYEQCDLIKVHCMYDCADNTAWLSTAQ